MIIGMPLYLGLHAEVSDSRPRLDVFAVLGLMRACKFTKLSMYEDQSS